MTPNWKATQVVAKAIYHFEMLVDTDVQMGAYQMNLGTPADGLIHGNTLDVSMPITTTAWHKDPDDPRLQEVKSLRRPDESVDSDETLAAAARNGESDALEQLLRRHESPILAFLRSLGIPPADREDVAQEIFIRLFRHLDHYRPAQPFRPWLYRIAINASHDYRNNDHRDGQDSSYVHESTLRLKKAPSKGVRFPSTGLHRLGANPRTQRSERAGAVME